MNVADDRGAGRKERVMFDRVLPIGAALPEDRH
jgi:hypothetical protein